MNFHARLLLLSVFFMSGFTGLIYESIWSQYLKLFLGHAAYAQTLVLLIYMGGMAIGAWLTATLTAAKKINFLLAYALLEATIGALALVFHDTFVHVTEFSFETIIPALHQPSLINSYKWLIAGLLITPQSILLGATFPLMTTGFLRRSPHNAGSSIATLYFINSLGASLGVLASGFILIRMYGLPGTIFTAGIINIALACCVWLTIRSNPVDQDYHNVSINHSFRNTYATPSHSLLLLISALTGLASFIYEIIWIRMLNLVLGTSTHAFELMLSAFILGLALGGLYIRSRIDSLKNPVKTLAWIQLAMGLLAASTTLLYNSCFELMAFLYGALQKNDAGYLLFNINSHLLALLVMLPATFCAGMTLPLITKILLEKNSQEKMVGQVYAANTVGSIIGIVVAVHLLQPVLGLKNTLLVGACVDIVLAILLFKQAASTEKTNFKTLLPVAIGLSGVLFVFVFSSFNLNYTASGVYRHGVINQEFKSIYHRDGKTATVDVVEADGALSIKTNGKPDAAVSLTDEASLDEPTMRLAAWIPLSLHPLAKEVAIIGMGSGLTTHSILASPQLTQVDTIEIEPEMVVGARKFGRLVERTFHDPRSKIHIEDAKTFFTSQKKSYDLIISEPSNPWVTGVSGLFSTEFYEHAKRHLNHDGLFVQWVHSYEMNDLLVGSIIKAIANNFDDYQLYNLGSSDLLVVAKPRGTLGTLSNYVFSLPQIQADLRKIDIMSLVDIEVRYMGNKEFFAPYLAILPTPANSDFYPILDQNADKSRFKATQSNGFSSKDYIFNLLGYREIKNSDQLSARTRIIYNPAATAYIRAVQLHQSITKNRSSHFSPEDEILVHHFDSFLSTCKITSRWVPDTLELAALTIPYLSAHQSSEIWQKITGHHCFRKLPIPAQHWIGILQSFSVKDYLLTLKKIQTLSKVDHSAFIHLRESPFFIHMIFISQLQLGQPKNITRLWDQLPPHIKQQPNLQFLVSMALMQQKR